MNLLSPITSARTLLFVPADDVRKVDRAWQAGADALIFDLEDSVAPGAKASARQRLPDLARRDSGTPVAVRMNAANSPEGRLDLEALGEVAEAIDGVVVPKASAEELAAASSALSVPLIALVETAEDVLHAERLARSLRVVRMMLGPFDLTAELGCEPDLDGGGLLLSRSQLVLASAAAGISSQIDGPFTELDNVAGLRAETERVGQLGFTGKACIHPRQLTEVATGLAPRPEQVDWARRVIAAYASAGGGGVLSLDGRMIDEPIARRARTVLAATGEGG